MNKLIEVASLSCPIEAEVSTLTSLPYEDNHFDAIWCVNKIQYLTVEQLDQMLAEFQRVVRPGGLVAVKEFDLTSYLLMPFDPMMIGHLFDAARSYIPNLQGGLSTLLSRQNSSHLFSTTNFHELHE
ncbi:MAG: class I SAM-dependent methyltransferase [Chloroflexota bacterium]